MSAVATERTVLATKLYGDMSDWPNDGRLSALNIRQALDASAGDAILDASALEMSVALRVVATLVRMQLLGPPARPAPLATAKTIGYGFMPASDCTLEHLEAAHCSTRRTRGPAGKSPPGLPP